MVAWDRAEGKARPQMDLSVVIPTFNQADLLKESLRSLIDQTLPHEAYEIVVVDDGSTDHTTAVLSEFGPPVRVVRLSPNRGRSAARNAGIRAAAAPLVALVDSDIIVRRDFLASHLEAHRQHGDGILSRGPVVDVPDLATARDGQLPKMVSSPAYLTTANAALAKDALVRAGLFDEHFPSYGWEDFDLGLRLKRLGVKRIFCRQAVAFHLDPNLDRFDRMGDLLTKEAARAASAVYFYRKHPTLEARWLIQATRLHRFLYWLQTGFGRITPDNVVPIATKLRRTGRSGLAQILVRGVLNRAYLRALESALTSHDPR
jgi:GT2 family glycosyltransferase